VGRTRGWRAVISNVVDRSGAGSSRSPFAARRRCVSESDIAEVDGDGVSFARGTWAAGPAGYLDALWGQDVGGCEMVGRIAASPVFRGDEAA